MLQVLLMSTAAGVIGTGMGGLIGLIFGKKSSAMVSYLLALASGVMLSIVFFDLIPEALSLSNLYVAVLSIIAGVMIIWLMNLLIDVITDSRKTHVQPEELRHQGELLTAKNASTMLRSGIMMFAAIALHNLPEGMAIGAGAAHDDTLGLTLAILIALHNIPEGISIAVPLIEGGMNRGKAILLTAVSGAPTLIGGWLGAFIGKAGIGLIGASLGIAGGAMLYVVFCEIMPQAIILDRSRKPAFFSMAGVLFGLIMVQVLA